MKNEKRIAAGDRHNGRQVEIVYDDSGVYVYKPRSAEAELAFEAFLSKLKQKGFPFIPEIERIIDSGDGWYKAEFIENKKAESEEDIREYFNRCGALIFILYIFGTTDIHSENLIASKNSPVLVDIETLLSAKADSGKTSVLSSLADSVLKSHLLPNWIKIGDENFDCSGICGGYSGEKNILVYGDKKLQPYDYCDFIEYGFEKSYKFALNNKDFMLGCVNGFNECYFRFILRPTEVYSKIINFINSHEKEKRRMYAEYFLSKSYKKDIRKNRFEEMKAVFDSEVESVLKSDTPVFLSKGNSADLYDSEKISVKKNFFISSPSESIKNKISALSKEDCEAQKKIIRQSISASRPIENKKIQIKKSDNIFKEIADDLEENSTDTFSDWIMLECDKSGCLFFKNSGFGLYDGMLGILCCYAAIYYKTGEKKYLDLIEKHYEKFRNIFLKKDIVFPLSDEYCSFQNGTAGFISALLHIADLTGEKFYRSDAFFLSERVSDSKADLSFDVMNGAAGVALSLPKLPKKTGMKTGRKILPVLIEYEPNQAGVAHGASGIALAIAKIQSTLGIKSFDEKILSLLRFENSLYVEEKKNWKVSNSGFMYGWCAGAPGIIMARNELLRFTDNPEIIKICNDDIMKAADFLRYRETKKDCLCCGTSSRLTAMSRLGIDCGELSDELSVRYLNDGMRLFSFNKSCDVKSGLMQGIAGAGYALAMSGSRESGDMLI